MSNEIVAVDDSTAPTNISNNFDIVDVQAAEDFMNNYLELVEALLDKKDYQKIGDSYAKKKSAWRKLATAFNISDEVVEKEIIRDECHRIISARFEVKATLPNGRCGIGTGSCSIFDKINKKDTEEPTPFQLRQRFTNAEHDVISTAHTRAKSRAISDLIGAGEVSAEELSGLNVKSKNGGPKPKPKSKKTAAKTPKKPVKSDDDAIEVQVVSADTLTEKVKSFKEICDSNPALTLAVQELQANESTVNTATVHDKLLDLWDMGKVSNDEYETAKALLE